MKYLAIILIGLISIFAGCNKTVTVRLRLYYGDSLVIGKWVQLSGPSGLLLSSSMDSLISLTTPSKPKAGIYIIQAIWGKDTAVYKYVLP